MVKVKQTRLSKIDTGEAHRTSPNGRARSLDGHRFWGMGDTMVWRVSSGGLGCRSSVLLDNLGMVKVMI